MHKGWKHWRRGSRVCAQPIANLLQRYIVAAQWRFVQQTLNMVYIASHVKFMASPHQTAGKVHSFPCARWNTACRMLLFFYFFHQPLNIPVCSGWNLRSSKIISSFNLKGLLSVRSGHDGTQFALRLRGKPWVRRAPLPSSHLLRHKKMFSKSKHSQCLALCPPPWLFKGLLIIFTHVSPAAFPRACLNFLRAFAHISGLKTAFRWLRRCFTVLRFSGCSVSQLHSDDSNSTVD